MRGSPDDRSPADRLAFGVVNLDKPPGPSAHQVTGWVRDRASAALAASAERASGHAAGVERAAHAGTLDPKVTGCLPILLGDATRLAQVFLEGGKEYVAVLCLHGPAPDDIETVLSEFEGPLYQKPPKKSAVVRQIRVRTVHELTAIEIEERRALIKIRCESGTYVRKLCHDLGLALGTGAHMGDLRRVSTTPFDDTNLVNLHELTDALAFADDGDTEALRETVQPAERALTHLPRVVIAESAAREVGEGAPVYAPGVFSVEGRESDTDEPPLVACYTPTGAAVCLGRLVGDPEAKRGTVVDTERVLI